MKELLPQYKLILVRERDIKYDHRVNSVDDAVQIMLKLGLADAPEEHLYMLCLDHKGSIIAIHEISHGTLAAAPVSVRALFSRALINHAAGIIIAHNHPSGDPSPSEEDISTTDRIKSAGELLEIRLMDHIIIGSNDIYSMKKEGYL